MTTTRPGGADVLVQMPSGTTKYINLLRMLVQTQNAEFKTRHDMFLPGLNKLRPTVKALRVEYELTCRTWEEAAIQMREFYNHLTRREVSYKIAVMVSGETKPSYNAMRFATKDEARQHGDELLTRWVMALSFTIEPSDDPVNYKIVNGVSVAVEEVKDGSGEADSVKE